MHTRWGLEGFKEENQADNRQRSEAVYKRVTPRVFIHLHLTQDQLQCLPTTRSGYQTDANIQ